MTTAEYLAALKSLGLTPHGKETAAALGVRLRAAQYYAAGRAIPETLEKLIGMYLRHGIPRAGKRPRRNP